MKKLSKALLPSICLLLVGIMSLTGITYAWFTTTNFGVVSQFEANVVEATGLEMSWDATTWKGTIAVTDPEYTSAGGNTSFTSFEYAPCSTAGTVGSGALSFYAAEITDDKISASTAATSGYVKFDLYFRVTGADATVNLDAESVVTDLISSKNTIGLASRVAFVQQGTVALTAENVVAAAKALNGGTSAIIWEPNATKHTPSGIADGATAGAKHSYFGLESAFSGVSISRKAAETGKLAAVTTKTNGAGDEISFSFGQGITKLSVYVWVEGQDVDCLNDLAATALQLKFKFVKSGS